VVAEIAGETVAQAWSMILTRHLMPATPIVRLMLPKPWFPPVTRMPEWHFATALLAHRSCSLGSSRMLGRQPLTSRSHRRTRYRIGTVVRGTLARTRSSPGASRRRGLPFICHRRTST
jgi:hypothetical protein